METLNLEDFGGKVNWGALERVLGWVFRGWGNFLSFSFKGLILNFRGFGKRNWPGKLFPKFFLKGLKEFFGWGAFFLWRKAPMVSGKLLGVKGPLLFGKGGSPLNGGAFKTNKGGGLQFWIMEFCGLG